MVAAHLPSTGGKGSSGQQQEGVCSRLTTCACGPCVALGAAIRAAAMYYALNQHAHNNEEVSRTLAAMRGRGGEGGGYAAEMPLLDR